MLSSRYRICYCLLLPMVLAVAGGPVGGTATPALAEPAPPAAEHTRYVPMTANGSVPGTMFGVEMTAVLPERNLDGVAALGEAWVRRNGLLWKDVEPDDNGIYRWSSPSVVALEREMLAASARNLNLILVVRGSPRWATTPYKADCAPINPVKYARFAAFLAAAVTRYSQPPFNVRYWELGNEPDAPIGVDSVFGCWGRSTDPYYGGRDYGNMLKAVYPAFKRANGDAQLVHGSLLLDKPGAPLARFFEGVLVSGAAESFDILGFHSYCMFDPNNPDGHDALFDSCATDWKIKFLRDLTRKYGVPGKPLLRTEAALLCWTPHQACRRQQADFVARQYARAAHDRLLGSLWYLYDSDSFWHAALVEPADPRIARPSFTALTQAAAMYGGAAYLGPLPEQPPGVEGHRFRRAGETVVVVWANQPQTAVIPVSAGVTALGYGRDGHVIELAAAGDAIELEVGPSPSYIVMR